jgi:hypothetical protein
MRVLAAFAVAAALAASPARAEPPIVVRVCLPTSQCGVACHLAETCADLPEVCAFESCYSFPEEWCLVVNDGHELELACLPIGNDVPPDLDPHTP